MLVFVKLGGSLITDKTREGTYHAEYVAGLSEAFKTAMTADRSLRLLVGHGSGSFGHFEAARHGTAQGVRDQQGWVGFAAVARAAARLNKLVMETLAAHDLPVWAFQPSASAECIDGRLCYMDTRTIQSALDHGLIPVVYGDVALDTVRGGTIISTESIFHYLAPILVPRHIFLLSNVRGVMDVRGKVIPRITAASLHEVEPSLSGSYGTDVTGGMAGKVREMVELAQVVPGLHIHILSGADPDVIAEALLNPDLAPGTVISGG
ncbi:MAG: isopentenyl phosphate kinase [Anaerolineae bacterium]